MERKRYQQGTVSLKSRKGLPDLWVLRYREDSVYKSTPLGTIDKLPTKAKAQKAAFALRAKINDQVECVRFHQLATRYEAEEMPDRESTKTSYLSILGRLRERWDNERLDVMAKKPPMIEEWLTNLKTLPRGNQPDRPISIKTKRNILNFLHLMFARAMAWEYLDLQANPIELVRAKDGKGVKRAKKHPRSLLDFNQLEALMKDEELTPMVKVMITVAMYTGTRVSEILGLKWEHIDFDSMEISIEDSVVGKHRDGTKTDSSQACVPMPADLAEALKWWEAYLPSVNGCVFGNPITGRPYHRDSLQKDYLKPAGLRLEIPDLGWHSFRHTYRSMLGERNIPLEVQQKLMRHSDIRMTLEYGKGKKMETLRSANDALANTLPMPMLTEGKTNLHSFCTAMTKGEISGIL
jgi:integrase